MPILRTLLISLLLALGFVAASYAQGGPRPDMSDLIPTTEDPPSQAHPAIGRLNQSGYRTQQHCTAWLIEPRVAVTAAHCLGGNLASAHHLTLGYDRGRWDEAIPIADVVLAEAGRDIAWLCLERAAQAEPLHWSTTAPQQQETLEIRGYGRPSVHALTTASCTVLRLAGTAEIVMECPASPGASGGPVLRRSRDGLAALGVVSRTTGAVTTAVRPIEAERRKDPCEPLP